MRCPDWTRKLSLRIIDQAVSHVEARLSRPPDLTPAPSATFLRPVHVMLYLNNKLCAQILLLHGV